MQNALCIHSISVHCIQFVTIGTLCPSQRVPYNRQQIMAKPNMSVFHNIPKYQTCWYYRSYAINKANYTYINICAFIS